MGLSMADGVDKKNEIESDKQRTTVALSTSETVSRYGSAGAEFIKGYTGVDNELGQKFSKGLADIAKHKVNSNPVEATKNIKQQAGFSAEVAATSHDNAEAIISGRNERTYRTDDIATFGKNHNVVDRVKILDGQIIEGSEAQMKFIGNRDQLFEDIVSEDGKFARYRGIKLELPSEQFEGSKEFYINQAEGFHSQSNSLMEKVVEGESEKNRAMRIRQAKRLKLKAEEYEKLANSDGFTGMPAAEYCKQQAKLRRISADKAESAGKIDEANKLRREAENYDRLANDIRDSGLTTKDAISYRKHPKIATAIDIAKTSHRAGVEGAKYGSIIGGAISIFKNSFSVAQNKKDLDAAVKDVVVDTAQAGVIGYGTAFTGSVIKGAMQQSGNATVRAISKTNAPALVLSVCISLGSSIKRYVDDEITGAQFLEEVGEKGAGMLSSGMMAALGQLAIPIPFVGAAIGGMIGYTLSSMFYQIALDAGRQADASRERLIRIQKIESAAREEIDRQRVALSEFMQKEFPELMRETEELFECINSHGIGDMDIFAAAINSYAELMGAQLQFKNQMEFDDFMLNSDEPLLLNKPVS